MSSTGELPVRVTIPSTWGMCQPLRASTDVVPGCVLHCGDSRMRIAGGPCVGSADAPWHSNVSQPWQLGQSRALAWLVPADEEKLEGAARFAAGLELVPCWGVKLPVRLWPEHPGRCGSGGGGGKASHFCLWFPTAEGCGTRGSGRSHTLVRRQVLPPLPGEPPQDSQELRTPSMSTAEMG